MILKPLNYKNLTCLLIHNKIQTIGLKKQKQIRSPGSTRSKPLFEDVKFEQKDLKSIEQVNKYFLGIRINTKYAKFYNQDTIANVDMVRNRKINQLPFSCVQKEKGKSQEVEQVNVRGLCKHILGKIQNGELEKKMAEMAAAYFTDLIENKRTVKIQPNFERQARSVFSSLRKDNYTFQLKKSPQPTTIKILSTQLFKGLQVTRNNNYSIDSYEILQQSDYTHYKLWQKGTYKIPQQEWFTKSNMLIRITTRINNPYEIQILKNKQKTIQINNNYSHIFVFQMDLKKPPKFAQFRLNQRQYFKEYQPVLENLVITNVDGKNQYFAFTYEEKDKKGVLINKLV